MDDKKEKIKDALIAFFDNNGGHVAIAETIGMSGQALYNVRIGRNAIKFETLLLLRDHYGETFAPVLAKIFELHGVDAPKTLDSGDNWKVRYEALETKYDALQTKFDDLSNRFNDMVDIMMQKVKVSFNASGSHTTAIPVFYPIGFGVEHSDLREAKVIQHPATTAMQTPVYTLNSLATYTAEKRA